MNDLLPIVKRKGKSVKLIAPETYINPDSTVMKMTNNGNGYTIKWPSQKSTEADIYLSLDYSQAADIFIALKAFEIELFGFKAP
jgi:hypothetical protein